MHISQLADEFVANCDDHVKEGDMVRYNPVDVLTAVCRHHHSYKNFQEISSLMGMLHVQTPANPALSSTTAAHKREPASIYAVLAVANRPILALILSHAIKHVSRMQCMHVCNVFFFPNGTFSLLTGHRSACAC